MQISPRKRKLKSHRKEKKNKIIRGKKGTKYYIKSNIGGIAEGMSRSIPGKKSVFTE